MHTKARVILKRKSTGMVAVETSAGSITVFELLGGDRVGSGDILSGCLEAAENQVIFNETRDEELRVFIHEHSITLHEAIERHFAQFVPSEPPRRPMWPLENPSTNGRLVAYHPSR